MRLFKITRHYRSTKVLISTAKQIWKQVLAMVSFLIFITTVFAILLYEVEKGNSCYVGDEGCDVPPDALPSLRMGAYISINKAHQISKFPNALDGLWYSMVSLTSTGYGDMVPETNLGSFMGVLIMLFGSLYMAMPLTAASTVFYQIHQHYDDQLNKSTAVVAPLAGSSAINTSTTSTDSAGIMSSPGGSKDIEAQSNSKLNVPIFARGSVSVVRAPPLLDDAFRSKLDELISKIDVISPLFDAFFKHMNVASDEKNVESVMELCDKVVVMSDSALPEVGKLLSLQSAWLKHLRSRSELS